MSTSKKYLNNCILLRKVDPGKTIKRLRKNPVGKLIVKASRKAAIYGLIAPMGV
jgi:hypothetical protein